MTDADSDLILPRRRQRIEDAASRRLHEIVVVLDNLQDPHNASAVLRSCDVFGVQNVYVIERSRQFSVTTGISHGCERWLDIHPVHDPDSTLAELKRQGFRLLAADPDERAVSLYDVDFTGKVGLVFGNETDGVAGQARGYCDGSFVIPMAGFSRSLNVSVAAAVAIAHAVHQRRLWLGEASTDCPQRSAELAHRWVERERATKTRGVTQ